VKTGAIGSKIGAMRSITADFGTGWKTSAIAGKTCGIGWRTVATAAKMSATGSRIGAIGDTCYLRAEDSCTAGLRLRRFQA
jgi:hypothetical protein